MMSEDPVRSPEHGEQPSKRQRDEEESEAQPAPKAAATKEAPAAKERVDRDKVC